MFHVVFDLNSLWRREDLENQSKISRIAQHGPRSLLRAPVEMNGVNEGFTGARSGTSLSLGLFSSQLADLVAGQDFGAAATTAAFFLLLLPVFYALVLFYFL